MYISDICLKSMHPWFQFPNNLSLVFLPIKITLKRFIERFFVRKTKSITKNPSRNLKIGYKEFSKDYSQLVCFESAAM